MKFIRGEGASGPSFEEAIYPEANPNVKREERSTSMMLIDELIVEG